ncbi:MAG: RNA polymerase sigma factor [Actinobacteria bacterium]|nr:RNA polymerase sigma factor [Actinomycetota bacterium]
MTEAQDDRAFEDFYGHSFQGVFRVVVGLIGADEAWDVTQEAFVRTWISWDRLEGDDAHMRYTIAAAVGLSRSWLRRLYVRRSRSGDLVGEAETTSSSSSSPPDLGILEGLRTLPARQREALVLCDMYGLTAPEAATILHTNPGTTRVHLSRARLRMRQFLEEDDDIRHDDVAARQSRSVHDQSGGGR